MTLKNEKSQIWKYKQICAYFFTIPYSQLMGLNDFMDSENFTCFA